jgi:hypothetical protein
MTNDTEMQVSTVTAEMPPQGATVVTDTAAAPEATPVAKKAKPAGKAAVKAKPEAKPQVNMFTLGNAYPALKVWPADAGAKPSREQIITAAGLLGTKPGDIYCSKRVLGVASYLRDGSLKYAVAPTVALALQAVCGGAYNDIRNAANRDIVAPGFATLTAGKVGGKYKSYHLTLTARGTARVNKYRADHGLEAKGGNEAETDQAA